MGSDSGKRSRPHALDASNISCVICHDLLLEPVVAACGHDFCRRCYSAWTAKQQSCPMCRQRLPREVPGAPLEQACWLSQGEAPAVVTEEASGTSAAKHLHELCYLATGVCKRMENVINKLFPGQLEQRRCASQLRKSVAEHWTSPVVLTE